VQEQDFFARSSHCFKRRLSIDADDIYIVTTNRMDDIVVESATSIFLPCRVASGCSPANRIFLIAMFGPVVTAFFYLSLTLHGGFFPFFSSTIHYLLQDI